MKKIFLFPFLFLLICCGSKKNNPTTSNVNCPEESTCSIEIIKNKGLIVKNDSFGNAYYELEDSDAKNVILYVFEKNKDENIPDSGYKEEVIFEIDAKNAELNLTGTSLQQTKMLFGRFCFCRGATGYYKVNEGTLALKTEKGQIQFDLTFKINEVPQIISHITNH